MLRTSCVLFQQIHLFRNPFDIYTFAHCFTLHLLPPVFTIPPSFTVTKITSQERSLSSTSNPPKSSSRTTFTLPSAKALKHPHPFPSHTSITFPLHLSSPPTQHPHMTQLHINTIPQHTVANPEARRITRPRVRRIPDPLETLPPVLEQRHQARAH